MFKIPSLPPPTLSNPSSHPHLLNAFIASCLIKDPTLRPTASTLLKHPFLEGTNTKNNKNGGNNGTGIGGGTGGGDKGGGSSSLMKKVKEVQKKRAKLLKKGPEKPIKENPKENGVVPLTTLVEGNSLNNDVSGSVIIHDSPSNARGGGNEIDSGTAIIHQDQSSEEIILSSPLNSPIKQGVSKIRQRLDSFKMTVRGLSPSSHSSSPPNNNNNHNNRNVSVSSTSSSSNSSSPNSSSSSSTTTTNPMKIFAETQLLPTVYNFLFGMKMTYSYPSTKNSSDIVQSQSDQVDNSSQKEKSGEKSNKNGLSSSNEKVIAGWMDLIMFIISALFIIGVRLSSIAYIEFKKHMFL